MKVRRFTRFGIFLTLLGFAACASPASPPPPPVLPLKPAPYASPTVFLPPSPSPTASPSPAPSPTPFLYTVQTGDTFGAISLRYGVSLAALMAANPQTRPETLSVGQSLLIPPALTQVSLPTQAALLSSVTCHPNPGGFTCLGAVTNPQQDAPLENVAIRLSLRNEEGETFASQVVPLPLHILPAGAQIPVSAQFSVSEGFASPQAELYMAVSPSPGWQGRYPALRLQDVLTLVQWDGRSVSVQGKVSLQENSSNAQTVWALGVAYDEAGNILGYRKWEWQGQLTQGQVLPFSFNIYSPNGGVARAAVFVEAHP